MVTCVFAQNDSKHSFDRENRHNKEVKSAISKPLRSNVKKVNPTNFNSQLRANATKQRLDSIVSTEFKNKFWYDNNGNCTVSENYYRWEESGWEGEKSESTYDSNGNVIGQVYSEWDDGTNAWIKNEKDEYSYDSNRNIILEVSSDWNGNEWIEVDKDKYEYSYDNNGDMTSEVSSDWNGNAWVEESKDEYSYDSNRNMTSEVYSFWNGNEWEEESKDEYFYDSNGNMTSEVYSFWNGTDTWIGNNKSEYSYDSNENMISEVYSEWDYEASEWEKEFKYEYSYDSNGNIIQQIDYYWDNNTWIIYEKFEYEFDLSIPISNIVCPPDVGFDEFAKNKVTGSKSYRMIENSWQETDAITCYYSDALLGIPNISTTSVSIYPNPVSESFSISGITEPSVVTILNMTGNKVLQQTAIPEGTVAAGHLPSGVYFVNVKGEIVKLIKQ